MATTKRSKPGTETKPITQNPKPVAGGRMLETGRGGGGAGPDVPRTEESFVICHVCGDVKLIRDGTTTHMKAPEKEAIGIALYDGDRLTTGANGYIWGISSGAKNDASVADDDVTLTIFPKSEVVLHIRTPTKKLGKVTYTRHVIEQVEPIRGFFCVSIIITGTKRFWDKFVLPSAYQSLEVKPIFGEFKNKELRSFGGYIELGGSDGSLTLSHITNRFIYNGLEPEERLSSIGSKITLKNGVMYASKKPDQRDAEATRRLPIMVEITAACAMRRGLLSGTFDAAIAMARAAGDPSAYNKYLKGAEASVKEAEETEDPYMIQFAKNQLAIAKDPATRSRHMEDAAEMLAAAELQKQQAEKMVAKLPSIINDLQQPIPPFTPPSESDRVIVRTDITRRAKNYEQILIEQRQRGDELLKRTGGKESQEPLRTSSWLRH